MFASLTLAIRSMITTVKSPSPGEVATLALDVMLGVASASGQFNTATGSECAEAHTRIVAFRLSLRRIEPRSVN
jgi:hypothetical protein